MYGLWRPRVLGAWRVPPHGPVILAVNHSHNIDGPLLMGTAPRPVHFLIKKEAFVGPLGSFLKGIGQLRVDRSSVDRTAITQALGVLQGGGVLGIFPEGTRGVGDFASLRSGLAYFAVRSGAPIVPVAVLGTAERMPGGREEGTGGVRLIKGLPPLRSRVDLIFGDPFQAVEDVEHVPAVQDSDTHPRGRADGQGGDRSSAEAGGGTGPASVPLRQRPRAGAPRTRKALDEATLHIQERLTAHLEDAKRLTGR
jgi:1-acyl-sn-glycerol-3-phosphate acyltransferase